MVVIDPDDSDRALLDRHGVRFVHEAVTRDNYRSLLPPLLTKGGGRGFCVNLSVDTSSLDIMRLCRELGVLYIDTVVEPWAGLLFRQVGRAGGALELCAARDGARRKAQQPGRVDGGLLLRRQSRHGVVVRQAGADRPRRRDAGARRTSASRRPRRTGRAWRATSASRASTSPSATPSAPRARSR